MKNAISISFFIFSVILVFSNCENANKKVSIDASKVVVQQKEYLKKGQEIALAAQAVLGKNLMQAIKANGTAGALAFCNEKAIQLTDSTSMVLNAKIKRVSDKNRNSLNAANVSELKYIDQAKKEVLNSGSAEPFLLEVNNEMVGYYPIVTNGLCLKCHGDPSKDIDELTFDLIKEKYPLDKAVGYVSGEARGTWVISMDK